MVRKRMFLDIDVVEAARERVDHTYNIFDSVAVQISGGKDSTAALLLAKEYHDKHDLGPVTAIFRDEEMVSPAVESYLMWLRDQPWLNLEWYCLPQATEVWVLGRREYVQTWSPKRAAEGRLIRPMPEFAYNASHFGLDPAKPIPESIDYYTMAGKEGRVAFITGVRANESMIRYRSCVQKLHENYINHPYRLPKSVPLKFSKVIYDWNTNDVLKFIDDHDFPYCEFYDYAALSGANPRVGIPLHSVAARRISDVYETEPEFYDRLVNAFPQIEAQRRLWGDFDIDGLIASYAAHGWDGVRDCIDDNMLTPGLVKDAMRFAGKFRKKHASDPFSYPLDQLIRVLLLNEFHGSAPTPVGPKTRAHRMRMAAMQEERDRNSEDLIDDLR